MSAQFPAKGFKSAMNPYLYQQIRTASPEKLILILYDLGIKSCSTKDRQMAAQVLAELIGVLDFEQKDMALQFFDLYNYALAQVHQNNFDAALVVLRELRDVWQAAVLKQARNN
ncbi:MAG: flagellar export chaperone FliS [bacterium]